MTTAEAWILIDPVQFYEESDVILGVYESLHDAQAARPVDGRTTRTSYVTDQELPRMREAQLWRDERRIETWAFDPRTETWLEGTNVAALLDAEAGDYFR